MLLNSFAEIKLANHTLHLFKPRSGYLQARATLPTVHSRTAHPLGNLRPFVPTRLPQPQPHPESLSDHWCAHGAPGCPASGRLTGPDSSSMALGGGFFHFASCFQGSSWPPGIMLTQTFVHTFWYEHMLAIFVSRYLGVGGLPPSPGNAIEPFEELLGSLPKQLHHFTSPPAGPGCASPHPARAWFQRDLIPDSWFRPAQRVGSGVLPADYW